MIKRLGIGLCLLVVHAIRSLFLVVVAILGLSEVVAAESIVIAVITGLESPTVEAGAAVATYVSSICSGQYRHIDETLR